MRKILCHIFLLSSFVMLSQVKTVINSKEQKVGKPFILTYEVSKSPHWIFPDFKKYDRIQTNLKLVDIRLDTVSEKIRLNLQLIAFDSGNYRIPSYRFQQKQGSVFNSLINTIHVSRLKTEELKKKPFDIKPIKTVKLTLKDYLDNDNYYLIAFIISSVLLLVVLLLLIYRWLKSKKKSEQQQDISPAEQALKELSDLKKQKLWEHNTKAYYSELTVILRRYFERKLKIDALESTSDQILKKIESELEKHQYQKLQILLFEADMVKFAKSSPDQDKHLDYMKYSVNLIRFLENKADKQSLYFECLGTLEKKTPHGDFAIWWKSAKDDFFASSVIKKNWSEFYLHFWSYYPYFLGRIYLEKGLQKEQRDVFLPASERLLVFKNALVGTFLINLSKEKGMYILMNTQQVKRKEREKFLNDFMHSIRRLKKQIPLSVQQEYESKKYDIQAIDWFVFMEDRIKKAQKNKQEINKLGGKELK